MASTYWHKQSPDKPLFPDMLWSQPQNRASSGKLLIVGGNQYGFAAPAQAYREATEAGVGLTRVLLPQAVKKVAGGLFLEVEYAPSTPSGSFAQQALDSLLEQAAWADGVLFAGDLGHNSETAILIEKFLDEYTGQVTLTKDAIDSCLGTPAALLDRAGTLLVLTMGQLQKLAAAVHSTSAFTLGMDLLHVVDGLHDFSQQHLSYIVVKHLDQLVVVVNGQVSTTSLKEDQSTWRIKTAAQTSVWWLQNPAKPFEALSSSVSTSLTF